MAPCLSPSPSGRRLSELLEEKQEPFFLDLHLLEKGCSSSRLLDGYDTTVMCWPNASAAAAGGTGNDGATAAVLRRLTSKKNKAAKSKKNQKQQPAGGLLQLLLSKILGCSTRAAAAAQRKPAALQFSDSFKLAAVAPAPCSESDPDGHMELDAVKTAATADADTKAQDATAERYDSDSDSDSDDDEKQQLSPVSVLDHPFESSPVHSKLLLCPSSKGGAAAMDVFRDLLDAAYSPALLAQLLAKSEDLLGADEDDWCYRTSPKHCRDDESVAAYWDAHREELARVSELVASELPTSKLNPADVEPERHDVGAEVGAAVFEALMRELVEDLRSCSSY